MKFTLICEHDENYKVTHEFKNVLFSDTLDNIQNFLKGCGFVFDGTLDIVPEEEMFPKIQIEPVGSDFGDDHNEPLILSKEYRNSEVDQDGRC